MGKGIICIEESGGRQGLEMADMLGPAPLKSLKNILEIVVVVHQFFSSTKNPARLQRKRLGF